MAKRSRSRLESSVLAISKALGAAVGNAEVRWNNWKGQRDEVAQSLLAVRSKVDSLLTEIGAEASNIRTRVTKQARRGGRRAQEGVPVVQPGMRESRRKRVMSAQSRAKMRAAAKARWADAKKMGKKTLAKATRK